MVKRILFRLTAVVIVLVMGTATGAYLALVKGIPRIEEIKDYRPSQSTKVFADDDALIGEFRIEKGEYVPFSRIPEQMIRAVVSVEDSRFWYHKGVDYLAIARALFKDIRAGRIKEGASTITQQLAKVVFLSPERTVLRKIREAVLATRIERNLSKEDILELYLNKIYFGHGAHGVEMASRAYFGKSISDVGLSEAALLGGLIKAPSRYSPYTNLEMAKERQHIVLKRMAEEGYISQEDAEKAYNEPLYLSSAKHQDETPNYFLEYVRKYLEDRYGEEMTYKGGLKVYTTLNRNVQFAAVDALHDGLRELDKRQGYRGPLGHKEVDPAEALKPGGNHGSVALSRGDIMTATVLSASPSEAVVTTRGIQGKLFLKDAAWAKKIIDAKGNVIKHFRQPKLNSILHPGDIVTVMVRDTGGKTPVFTLEQEPLVQGAVLAIEPSTGYVRAIVGGYDFSKSEFNRAVFAKRQAGSAFKPIVYATAMDAGLTPASIVIDEPLLYESEQFGDWEPENYDEKYHGATRLREALIHSRNIVTVKLLQQIGVDSVTRFARNLGITGPFPRNLTLALGSLSTSPLELTTAFAAFANGGLRMTPIAIKYVIGTDGSVLENNQPDGVRVMSPQTAFLVTSMLEDVVKRGTGWRARALGRPVAGKTGTTNEYYDAWFIGFTPELAAGVWVGFDTIQTLGDEETGSRAAAPVWVSFMKKALRHMTPTDDDGGRQGKPFPVPDGIVTVVIDPLTGLLATNESEKMVEFFKEGTVPSEYSTDFYRLMVLKQKEELMKIEKKKGDKEDRSLSN